MKQVLRIEVDNTEATKKTIPHCDVIIHDDGVPVNEIKKHPNTSKIQIRLDVAEYLGKDCLTYKQRNMFIEEMMRPTTMEFGEQVLHITIWEQCKFLWEASDTVMRIEVKQMPAYETLEVKKA